MISAEEARAAIAGRVPVMGPVTLSLRRAAGFRLFRDAACPADVPPFDDAAMDGYAVHAEDVRGAGRSPVQLTVAGETVAGDPPGPPLPSGSARSIMTGSPVPDGADAVVQVEWTERSSDGLVQVLRPVSAGANIRRAGSDIRRGSVPLPAGRLLRAYEQGLLSSMGIEFVVVHRKPSVVVLPTGSELTPPGKPLQPGKIRESVSPVIAGLLRADGCAVRVAPAAADERETLLRAIAGSGAWDMLITTGGVSVGTRDLVPDALRASGVEVIFHKVNVKPGMPLLFGMTRKGAPVFSLPGNPVSAAVTFLQFVRPAIRKMSGDREPLSRTTVRARLVSPVTKSDGKRHYLRGILRTDNGEPNVRLAGPQVSNVASALAAANCLIVLPEDGREFRESEYVEAELL